MTPITQPIRYLDPKFDLTFKRLFGNNPRLLKSFLNALLPLPADAPIDTLEYLSGEHTPNLPSFEKYSIVDVKCKDTKGRIFTVEMQLSWAESFKKRLVFGGCQAFVKQLGRGINYSKLQPVYALALVNEIFEHHSDEFYHHYKFTHQSDSNCELGCLEFVLVELPKFKAETPIEKELMGLWLQFMNETGKIEAQIPDLKLQSNPDISEAMAQMQESAFNVAEKESYDQYTDKWRTHHTMLNDAEEKGKAEGEIIGLERGKAEGEILLQKSKLEIAKAIKEKGLDDATIIELTGLSAADLFGL